ncbi:SAM-dependent methyltransferase [Microbispora sp. NPDC004025]
MTVPSVARIYDHLLDGKTDFAVDRAAAEKLIELTAPPDRVAHSPPIRQGLPAGRAGNPARPAPGDRPRVRVGCP